MRKAMSHAITLIMVLVVGLVIIGLLIIMVGDKLGRSSDVADDTVDISIYSIDCPVECAKCCSSGYGNKICSKNYMACNCTCD
ncbi:MAG: type II secretion system protein [archaeon]|nr:type II secretion system protein [archaeon]